MKKYSIILAIAVMTALTLFSCKDDSGEFVEHLYTNAQKETAIRECLKTCADSAVNHLFVENGFYGNADYRISFSPLQGSLLDTLQRHGYGALVDTLVVRTNRLAESCKSQVSSALVTAIDSLTFLYYDELIDGNQDAITAYFELYKRGYLGSAFQSPVSIRLPLYHVNTVWSEMLQRYAQYTSVPLNFDIQNYIVGKMLDDVLQEMRLEEALVRTDSTHRSEKTALLGE